MDTRRVSRYLCFQCNRAFDTQDEKDMQEWHYGHDCEA